MLRLFFILNILILFCFASEIDDKIKNNKSILNKSLNTKNKTRVQIQNLAKQIKTQNKEVFINSSIIHIKILTKTEKLLQFLPISNILRAFYRR